MALTTTAKVKAIFSPDLDSSRDAALSSAINYAGAWIERRTGRTIESASYTEYFDGDGTGRDIFVRAGRRPVTHDGTSPLTVTEDGTSLTVSLGYDADADVIITGANEDRQCRLSRQWSRWNRGVQNIAVAYTAGWSTVPNDVEHLANEVAWLIFQSQAWLGKGSQSTSQGSVSWEKNLTPQALKILDALTVL